MHECSALMARKFSTSSSEIFLVLADIVFPFLGYFQFVVLTFGVSTLRLLFPIKAKCQLIVL